MDIEAIVKKYSTRWTDTGSMRVSDAIRAALTEMAAGYEQKLADMARAVDTDYEQLYREANERIHQLEAERVPEGWEIKLNEEGSFVVTKRDESGVIIGCAVGERAEHARHIPEETLWLLASDMLAAAPQQKKEGEL